MHWTLANALHILEQYVHILGDLPIRKAVRGGPEGAMTPNNSAPLRHENGTSSKLTPESGPQNFSGPQNSLKFKDFCLKIQKNFLEKSLAPEFFFGPLLPCILRYYFGAQILHLGCFH